MSEAQQTQREQPLYQAKHRVPVNLTFFLALIVVGLGIWKADPVLVLAGTGVAAFTWFANPRLYRVYPGALVVVYGSPRVRVIPFQKISHLDMLKLMIGDRLRVRLVDPLALRLFDRRRLILELKDPQTFHDQLQTALDEFRRTHPETGPSS
ncbi:MAG: hypothetical protein EXR54_03725 [Dehalococcoidia bacterium]|nr:hypothetical protein [Dehalococcoidia bacterium]MSQ16663.1 hypothetical protein [Dehalococcoidia bacterium]